MTYNELKEMYEGATLRTGEDDWRIIEETKGNCRVITSNCDDEDEIFFDVVEVSQ